MNSNVPFASPDSRSRDGPAEFLKGYAGYLQTDAYASYESVVKESAGRIIAVGCWAHVAGNSSTHGTITPAKCTTCSA